jgi:beta-N-acetylglucosaminidase
MTKTVKDKPKDKDAGNSDISNKYNKLKKRYKYTKVLESWEMGAKSIKSLLEERRFLKKKLDTFFKS